MSTQNDAIVQEQHAVEKYHRDILDYGRHSTGEELPELDGYVARHKALS